MAVFHLLDEFTILKQERLVELLREKSARNGIDYLIVDVRDPDQFAKYHIAGALNIPEGTLVGTNSWDAVELLRLEAHRFRHSVSLLRREEAKLWEQQTNSKPFGARDGIVLPDVESWPSPLPPRVIFHCNLSMIRGPKSAVHVLDGLYQQHLKRESLRREDSLTDDEIREKHGLAADRVMEVNLLEGGSKAWLRMFGPGGDGEWDSSDIIVMGANT
ncbi:hypothetical protein HDU93_005339 [Gonapodya sp. JEL0774]|nr:hypothetical protein HDU93_005339 [Gonapodya sp. JEL0774]